MSVQEDLASRREQYTIAAYNILYEVEYILYIVPEDASEEVVNFYQEQINRLAEKLNAVYAKIYEIVPLQVFTYTLVSEKYEVRPNTIEMAGSLTELPNIEFQLFREDGEEETDVLQYATICGQYVTFEHNGNAYAIKAVEGEFEAPYFDEEIVISDTDERIAYGSIRSVNKFDSEALKKIYSNKVMAKLAEKARAEIQKH